MLDLDFLGFLGRIFLGGFFREGERYHMKNLKWRYISSGIFSNHKCDEAFACVKEYPLYLTPYFPYQFFSIWFVKFEVAS